MRKTIRITGLLFVVAVLGYASYWTGGIIGLYPRTLRGDFVVVGVTAKNKVLECYRLESVILTIDRKRNLIYWKDFYDKVSALALNRVKWERVEEKDFEMSAVVLGVKDGELCGYGPYPDPDMVREKKNRMRIEWEKSEHRLMLQGSPIVFAGELR